MENNDCKLIEIKQKLPGFNKFIGAWFYSGDINFVVDVGPANSVFRLIEVLTEMKVETVDYVFLTHIHIDHAGGLARFLAHFPMAKVICHEKGIKHLVDPEKLWEGSAKVLGEIAELYGRLSPVEENYFISQHNAPNKDIVVIETPGHAPHHLSFVYNGYLFVGEAGGNYLNVRGKDYLRPATPTRFHLTTFLNSIETLSQLEDMQICYAHFGKADSSHEMLKRIRDQILNWEKIICRERSSDANDLMERCVKRLLSEDPELNAFQHLKSMVQKRELFFIQNSIRGYLQYLENR
ncbi:MAG: MBL fold metallo-hydrolase [Desulfobacterales bacterium]|jgi:glyoxylase-like metal-dependent hydrolase (beta-lactamase superfamily II)